MDDLTEEETRKSFLKIIISILALLAVVILAIIIRINS